MVMIYAHNTHGSLFNPKSFPKILLPLSINDENCFHFADVGCRSNPLLVYYGQFVLFNTKAEWTSLCLILITLTGVMGLYVKIAYRIRDDRRSKLLS